MKFVAITLLFCSGISGLSVQSLKMKMTTNKPAGVPDENWLPINRKDEGLSINLRIYVPDMEKMKT